MKRITPIFLLLITFSLVFAGSVSAQQVDVEVADGNGDPVTEASPGDEVTVEASAIPDKDLEDPAVLITVDPESGLTFDEEKAVMVYSGTEYKNDPTDPFFYWSDDFQAWIWWVGWVFGEQWAGVEAYLSVPAVVSAEGPITVNADYMEWPEEADEPILVESTSYSFLSVGSEPGPEPVNASTVPMQDTGLPLTVAALGLLSVIGGVVYGKLR